MCKAISGKRKMTPKGRREMKEKVANIEIAIQIGKYEQIIVYINFRQK